jgi:hypothetical protein
MGKMVLNNPTEAKFVALTAPDGVTPFESPRLPELAAAEFLIQPISPAMEEEWQKRFRVCRKCGGWGMVPYGDNVLAICPSCHDKEGAPSLNRLDIQLEIVPEFVLGWRSFADSAGEQYDVCEENFRVLIEGVPGWFAAAKRAGIALFRQRAAASGKA